MKHPEAVEHLLNLILDINQDVKPESLNVEVEFRKTPKFFGKGRFMQMPSPLYVENYHENDKQKVDNDIEPIIEHIF